MTFDEFVQARLPGLLRYATVVTCDPHLAEDVVQEVLVRAQSRWKRIGAVDAPDLYLRRMILNEFVSWRRRALRRATPVRQEVLDGATPAATDPATEIVERDTVVAMLAALPPRQRAVIALRYYYRNTDAEIADLLGCRPATVRSHAARALTRLREQARAAAWLATAPSPPRAAGDARPEPSQ